MKKIVSILIFLVAFAFCTSAQKKLSIVKEASDIISLSSVSIQEANRLFIEFKNASLFNIADCNNCEDRANAIAYILEKRGYTIAKFWLFGEGKISLSREIYLLKSEKCGTWGYHVAVGMLVGQDTIIIDPATQNEAVTLKNWALPLIQKDRTGYLLAKNPIYYTYPVNYNKFQVKDEWLSKDTALLKTACGLCGLKPKQCGKPKYEAQKNAKLRELQTYH